MAAGSRSSSEVLPVETAVPAWTRFLLPSVGNLLFVSFFVVLLFSPLAVRMLGDGGIGWHIRNGQQVLATHTISRVDTFSSLMNGKPWFAWEWLYDVIVGALESWAGLNAVVWFNALIIATTFAWMFRLLVRRGAHFLAALVLVLLALSASTIHLLARPHLVSWLFTLIYFWILDSTNRDLFENDRPNQRRLWLLPLLMIVWVNVHGGFLVGFALLGIYWVKAIVQRFHAANAKFDDFLEWMRSARRLKSLTAVGIVTAAATFLNPYSWKLHSHIYQYLTDRYLMGHIEEFQSPNFHGVAERCFVTLILIAILALALQANKLSFSHGAIALFAIYSGLYAARDIPVSSILLAMVIGPLLPLHALEKPPENGAGFWQRMAALELQARGHIWAMAALLITFGIVADGGRWQSHQLADARFDSQRFPAQATTYLEAQHIPGPVLSLDSWGGYLIYRFTVERPELRVVLDDRHDLYGDETFKSYVRMIRVTPGWDNFLLHHQVGSLLLPQGSPLANIVTMTGAWKTIYSDDVAVLLVRTDLQRNQ